MLQTSMFTDLQRNIPKSYIKEHRVPTISESEQVTVGISGGL
jgi:hypothetical protein